MSDPARRGPIVGIDLGTTFSSIAFLNAFGRAEVIPTEDGSGSIPSVVLFPPDGEAVVGAAAKERSAEHPGRVVEFVKREMGDPDWVFAVDGREVRPQTISALILRELLALAEAALGERPTAAVITCPAYFGDLEREATAQAGRLAGIEVLAVFNEPTAAALAYGLHHVAQDEQVRALVYDLGGGTFDVTVLELEGRRVKVLATAGEHRLGGKEWDDELLNFVAEEFEAEFDRDPRDDPGAMQDLRNRCEAAKVVLSRKAKVTVFCRAFGETLKRGITRDEFEELTRPLLLQTRTYLDTVLRSAGVRWEAIDVVLPVGGSSHMPQVKTLLREASGRPAKEALDCDLAVVQGAAYYAALLLGGQGFSVRIDAREQPTGRVAKRARSESDELPMLPPAAVALLPGETDQLPALPAAGQEFSDLVCLPGETGAAVVNVNAHSLGVLVHKKGEARVRVMIPANTQLPAVERSRFFTLNDDQTAVRVVVLEGEHEEVESCARVGTCVISGLPARPKGQEIEISYHYDADGRIFVEARDTGTGQRGRVTLERRASLSEGELAEELAWVEALGR